MVRRRSDPDCTTTGCAFGTPLPISSPVIPVLSSCMLNTWTSAASGSLDRASGAATVTMALSSDIYLTGNLSQPCPRCSASGTPGSPGTGTCDRGPRAGLAYTTTNPQGLSRDCPTGGVGPGAPCTPGGGLCLDGAHVGPFAYDPSPLTTATSFDSDPAGLLCPGQMAAGCFGSAACRSIEVRGVTAGPITPAIPAAAVIGSVFCVPATGMGGIDTTAGLPGPGAAALRGTLLVH